MHLTRPLVLRAFADLLRASASASHETKLAVSARYRRFAPYILKCVDAAKTVTQVIQDFVKQGYLFHAVWFPQYIAFCAVIVLYIYTIQDFHRKKIAVGLSMTASSADNAPQASQRETEKNMEQEREGRFRTAHVASPSSRERNEQPRLPGHTAYDRNPRLHRSQPHGQQDKEEGQHLTFDRDADDHYSIAEMCQAHIARATPPNSFSSRRCNIILEELRLEVCRQTDRSTHPSPASDAVVESNEHAFPENPPSMSHQQQPSQPLYDRGGNALRFPHNRDENPRHLPTPSRSAPPVSMYSEVVDVEALEPFADLAEFDAWVSHFIW